MLKIDSRSKSFLSLGRRTLEAVPLFGRHRLAEFVANSPDVFFADLGRALFLLERGVAVDEAGARRADLLLIDPQGRLCVARLQRADEPIDLVEALEDAGCIAEWRSDRVLALLDDERKELLQRAFLEVPVEHVNREQGVLLLAEEYDLDTLATAGWLKARYGVRIDCYKLRLVSDSITQIEYLSCRDLSREIDRIYGSRRNGDPDGAPWPSEATSEPKREPDYPEPPPPPEPQRPKPRTPPSRPAAAPPEPAPAPEPAPISPTPLEAEVAEALDDASPQPEPTEVGEMIIPDDLAPEDDPLADVIAGLEEAEAEPQGAPPSDRRVAGRSRDYQARRLRLDYFGRLLGARLVDFSSVGLGVEALSPLPVGAEIGISGEIAGEAGSLAIEGRAKVEHCRSTEDGVCRIGFSLEKAQVSELDDPETFDRR